MARRIYWLSESIGPIEWQAIKGLHGEDVEVILDLTTFASAEEFVSYLQTKDGFVYALEHAVSPTVLARAAKESKIIFGTVVGKDEKGVFHPTHVIWVNWPKRNKFSTVWPGATATHLRN